MGKFISFFFDIDGKLSRKQFFIRSIIIFVYAFILKIVMDIYVEMIVLMSNSGMKINITIISILGIIFVVFALFALISTISLQIRRLNDLNKSKMLIILWFIPPINILFFFYLILVTSKDEVTEINKKQ